LVHVLMFIAGLAALVAGASLLVRGASRLALSFGISPLVVGLTVVAVGTSAPEVAVSVGAVLDGRTDIAAGNVVGSNIFNVLFILGASAVIVPLAVHTQAIRQEVPIMIGASLLLLAVGLDGRIGPSDAVLLCGLLIAYTAFLVHQSRRENAAAAAVADTPPAGTARTGATGISMQIGLVVAGLALLVLGADWLVAASVVFAQRLGVSDLVIGLTIVAGGTSLPEVATSITAALRGERDIAVGNVLGSNTFNILGCLGIAGLASGSAGLGIAPSLLSFDIWVMLAVALACLPVFLTGREIARWEGAVFLAYYVLYVTYLILAAHPHDALRPFSTTMLSFVVPLTLVTLVVSVIRRPVG
jgi:cation:H+ antiporter